MALLRCAPPPKGAIARPERAEEPLGRPLLVPCHCRNARVCGCAEAGRCRCCSCMRERWWAEKLA